MSDIRYKTKREKLKDYIELAIDKISDGDARAYNQFVAKCIIETGSKKELVVEFLNYYVSLKKIIIDETENSITVPQKIDDEVEKELEEVFRK